jgi:hypothetical protein
MNIKTCLHSSRIVWMIFFICLWAFLSSFMPRAEKSDSEESSRFGLGRDVVVEEGKDVDMAIAIGGNVNVYGHVRKDTVSIGGSVFLAPLSIVDGNVVAVGGQVVQQEGARVGGKISVLGTGRLSSIMSWILHEGLDGLRDLAWGIGWISSIGFILLALVTVAVIPSVVGAISFRIEHNTLGTLFLGIIGSVAIFPIGIVLLISFVGIVLIPLEMMLVGCAMILGYIAVSQLIGKKMTVGLKRPHRPILTETALGLAVLFLAGFVPFFGFLFKGFIALLGFGGVIDAVFLGWTRRE